MSPNVMIVIYCLGVLAISMAGGLVPLWSALTHTRLQMYLSFGSGVMLGAAILHMLPEALHLTGDTELTCLLMALGLLTLFLTERFFASHHHEHGMPVETSVCEHGHEHEHGHDHSHAGHHHGGEEGRARLTWPAVAIGLSVHTAANGIALASAVSAWSAGGSWLFPLQVFLAIALHKPADSMTIVTMMLKGRANRATAYLVNFLFASIVPLGVVGFYVLESRFEEALGGAFTGYVLAFSTGMFLCVALTDLLPELHFHGHDRGKLTFALLAGIALMYATGLFEGHSHGGHKHGDAHEHHDHDGHDHGHDHSGAHSHEHDAHDHDHAAEKPKTPARDDHGDHDHDHGSESSRSKAPPKAGASATKSDGHSHD